MQDLAEPENTAIEQKQLVTRIIASELFAKSHRLSAFLRFIFEQYSAGKADTINEQRIGTEVFGRQPGYHVGEDSIVRSQARFLRQRLEDYFSSEGRQESLVLTIPKGSYIPAFERRMVQTVLNTTHADISHDAASSSSFRMTRSSLFVAVSACLFFFAIAFLYQAHRAESKDATSEPPIVKAFWASIFHSDRNVLIVPADSTLVLMQEATGKSVPLLSYINRDYLQSRQTDGTAIWAMLNGSQYTSMADLNLVAHLERVPEVATSNSQIRYARDLSLKELKDNNAILIGGRRANPWVELFAQAVNFDVDYDVAAHRNMVRNRAPGPNEHPLYIEDTSGVSGETRSYGAIMYVSSLDNHGHTLLVEGTSKAGTEAAAEFLTGPELGQFLSSLKSTAATVPSFELLLSTGSIDGASYHPVVVCWHPLHSVPSN